MLLSGATKMTVVAAIAAAAFMGLQGKNEPTPPLFEAIEITLADGKSLQVGRDEIRHALWMECVADSACEQTDQIKVAVGAITFPVTDINPMDIAKFIDWLNAKTNESWRLPTLSEWRDYSSALPKETRKRFTDPRLYWAADYGIKKPSERAVQSSGYYGALPNGLRDIGGNVWEWTSTCTNGEPEGSRCPAYFVVGEHEAEIPIFLRDVITGGCSSGTPPTNLGFRVVREIKG